MSGPGAQPTVAVVGPGVAGGDPWSGAVDVAGPLSTAHLRRAGTDHVLLCPAGVRLLPEAGAVIGELLLHNPEVDLAYADSFSGEQAHHRPGFSPERLRVQMYLGPVLLIRRTVVEAHLASGEPLDLPPTLGQANALAVRCRVVAHLPRLLYRTEDPTDRPAEPGQTPLGADGHDTRLAGERFGARAVPRVGDGSTIDLRPRLDDHPPVSIVMPTVGARREIDGRTVTLCLHAIDRLVATTSYRSYELVVVLTRGAPAGLAEQVLDVVRSHPGDPVRAVRFCRDEREFNFSNACNRGAVEASGSVLVFLNDDTAVRTADWLQRLVMYATRPDIGAVGARLLYGDGTIQHAGIWTRGGHPTHRYEGYPADHRGHLDSLTVAQNCVAVTGACLAVEAGKFREVGGFCPRFPSSYNDVDLCLKLDELGYRTVVDPGAVLTHYEASSRDPVIEDWELELLHRRWRRALIDDPYDNPNHLAPLSGEFPPPDPAITLRRQRAAGIGGLGGHLPRLWRRTDPALDLRLRPTGAGVEPRV